jgi:hypothetical protein
MNKTSYPWQRLWVSDAEAPIDYSLDHNGYFSPWGRAQGLENWQETPCLILLGEPGMGKSWIWKQLKQNMTDGLHCFFNLGDISSADQLTNRIERNSVVKQWLVQPDTILWLWLDSFDEGLLHERKLAQALRELIKEWPKERLRFRILSRTATWPEFFTQHLLELFVDQPDRKGVHKLHLAPLTQVQVQEAAEIEGIVATDFFTAVENADAVAMAIRPVTLSLLFGLWQAGEFGGAVKRSKGELFAAGCRRLCEENWDEQRTRPADYDPDIRLRVAAHLALLMVFGNRQTLLFYEPEGQIEERELLLREVVGETTLPGTKPGFILGQPLVKQVLEHTSLFAPTLKKAFWAHQAYADFLAAWALHDAQVPLPQLRNLFRSTVPDAGVVPALRDTAVWLASLSPEFAAALVEMDTLTAIRADGLTATDAQRAQLVDSLLQLAHNRHFYPRRAEPYLVRLRHPNLAAQITPALASPDTSPEARWLIYHLIEHCKLTQLAGVLVQQVLDPTLEFNIRRQAIRALKPLANDTNRLELRPAIHNIPADDKDAEFRGTLLKLLWPTHLSVVELLPLLTPRPASQVIGGAYHTFLDSAFDGGFQRGITPDDLPHLLRWILRRTGPANQLYGETEQRICKAVLASAWQATDHANTLRWLARVITKLLMRHHRPLYLPKEAIARRRVVQKLTETNQLPSSWELIQPRELEKTFRSAPKEAQALVELQDWSFLLHLLSNCQSEEATGTLYAASDALLHGLITNNDKRFQEYFSQLYEVVQSRKMPTPKPYASWVWDIYSDIAEHNREQLLWNKKSAIDKAQNAYNKRRFNRRLLRQLIWLTKPGRTTFFADWHQIYSLLDKANISQNFDESDMAPLFKSYPMLTKRIISLVQRVVTLDAPSGDEPRSINTYNYEHLAYYQALIICIKKSPDSIAHFTAIDWQPWLHLMLFTGWNYQLPWQVAKQYQRKAVIQVAFQHIELRHNASAERLEWHSVNNILATINDDVLYRLVLSRIMSGKWQFDFAVNILQELLKLGFRPAELFCDTIFAQLYNVTAMHRLTFDIAKRALFGEELTHQWWNYWELLMYNHPDLLKQVVATASGTPSWEAPFPKHLDDEQLSTVLIWLVQKAGINEENQSEDYHIATSESRLRTARNTVAKRLAECATTKAWDVLNTLAISLAHPRWLAYPLEEAREVYSRVEWVPFAPNELLSLCRKSSQRWIQGGDDLLDAIVESLDRLQERMQGEPASATFLWYPAAPSDISRVRDGNKVVNENVVSSFVQRFLIDDLPKQILPVHREVQLRVPSNPGTGQDVDLYVTATARNKYGELIPTDVVTVLIEAKHNDNEVTTSLNNQLVNRYLKNHPTRFGLFLAYWHTAETGRSMSSGSISELRKELARQAQSASKDGLSVRSYVLDIRLPEHL